MFWEASEKNKCESELELDVSQIAIAWVILVSDAFQSQKFCHFFNLIDLFNENDQFFVYVRPLSSNIKNACAFVAQIY